MPNYNGITIYFVDPWLAYSSANDTICTVDEQGHVTGVSAGITTITVTSKITGDYGICTVHVVNPDVRNMAMIYPHGSSSSSYFSTLQAACAGFYNTFGILFSLSAHSSPELTQILSACSKEENEMCDEECGYIDNCNNTHTCNQNCQDPCLNINTHHRSAVRLLYVTPSGVNTDYTIRYISSPLCTYQYNAENANTSHYQINGARLPNTGKIVIYDDGSAVGTTQHEISHMFGTLDNYGTTNCSSPKCVMSGDTDVWCSNCFTTIMNNRAS